MLRFGKYIVLITAFSLLLLSGCSITGGTGTLPTGDTGTVTVSVPTISGVVSSLLQKLDKTVSTTPQLADRAYLYADKLVLTLKDNAGTVVDTKTFSVDGDQLFGSNAEATVVAAPGTSYTIEAQLYNTLTDSSNPLLAGTSAFFDITAGSNTPVDIGCTPISPTVVSMGTASPEVNITPWFVNEDEGTVTPGQEEWFSFIADSNYTKIEMTFSDPSKDGGALAIFDAQGSFVDFVIPWYNGNLYLLSTTIGETYYLGAFAFSDYLAGVYSLEASPFTFTLSDAYTNGDIGSFGTDPIDLSVVPDNAYYGLLDLTLTDTNTSNTYYLDVSGGDSWGLIGLSLVDPADAAFDSSTDVTYPDWDGPLPFNYGDLVYYYIDSAPPQTSPYTDSYTITAEDLDYLDYISISATLNLIY